MLVAAQLFALACLGRMDLPRRGQLRLAVGADEEVGGRLGFGWLAQEKADFLKCDIAICEGGGTTLGQFGGAPVIGVSSGEKGRYDVVFRLQSDGGHACAPWKHLNPIETLRVLLERIAAWEPELQTDSPIFPHIAEWFEVPTGVNPFNLEKVIEKVEKTSHGLATSLRGQSRMTLTPTVISGGDKANQIPTEVRLVCDARLLPGQTEKDLEALVGELVVGLPRLSWVIESTSGPSVSPWDEHLAGMFARATQRALEGTGVQVAPTWCIGATDARYVRSVGTPVYGYQLIHPGADQGRLDIHCIDESIEAGMLLPCALALAHLALEYLGEEMH
jgi:acetylornithine deacetylase/succinyl-diaminopimelate desuccinylase-like protein